MPLVRVAAPAGAAAVPTRVSAVAATTAAAARRALIVCVMSGMLTTGGGRTATRALRADGRAGTVRARVSRPYPREGSHGRAN
ncbi:hypothetical protein GCM10010507_42120 [Streptomyces cinnamoneus]|uniref:Uncharacterized protein n=1 Tax=Streptomyces cinnamoneus TaxID=53446 RepID=A0A918WNZ3_STRCJ|nr:hypothetical protein GCM10010507_42120 [Streptomyces cinnamoneus]